MFSRDNKHYRPTPRTIQQAFGPYARFHREAIRESRKDVLGAVIGILILGVIYGFFLAS
jgi:hypothetical protein